MPKQIGMTWRRLSINGLYMEMQQIKGTTTEKSCAPCSTSSWLQEAMKRCIPHKAARAKTNKLGIIADMFKLTRKRHKTCKKMKKSGWQELKDEIRKLRLWNTMQAPLNLLELPKWHLQWTRLHTSRHGDEEQTLDLYKAGVSPLKKDSQLLNSIRPNSTGWTSESAVPVSVQQWQTVHGRQVLPEDRDEQCYISWHSLIDHIQINEASMKELLLNLDPYKASGSDKICPGILKELADEISPMLTVIF